MPDITEVFGAVRSEWPLNRGDRARDVQEPLDLGTAVVSGKRETLVGPRSRLDVIIVRFEPGQALLLIIVRVDKVEREEVHPRPERNQRQSRVRVRQG
jgi:hypothetical protein